MLLTSMLIDTIVCQLRGHSTSLCGVRGRFILFASRCNCNIAAATAASLTSSSLISVVHTHTVINTVTRTNMSQLPPSTLSFTTSTSMPAQVSNMAAAPMASAATVPAAAAPLPAAAPTFLAGVSSVMQSSSMLPITHPPAQHLVSQKRIQDLVTSG